MRDNFGTYYAERCTSEAAGETERGRLYQELPSDDARGSPERLS